MISELAVPEAAPQNCSQRPPAIAPGNLLPLGVGAAAVADRNLENAGPPLRQADRQFWFNSESVQFQAKLRQYAGTDGLITGLNIGQVQIANNVGQQSTHAVSQPF